MTIKKVSISFPGMHWYADDGVPLTSNNCDSLISSPTEVDVHIDLTRFEKINLSNLFEHVTTIELVGLDIDILTTLINQEQFNFHGIGRVFYEIAKYPNKVIGYEIVMQAVQLYNKLITSVHTRDADKPILWAAGCSYTYGQFVNVNERYSTLLADKLTLTEKNIAIPGASIYNAAMQIFNADLKPNDIVIWGLTNLGRVEITKDFAIKHLTISNYFSVDEEFRYWAIDYFGSQTDFVKAIEQIESVIKYCKLLDVRLIIANLIDVAWLPLALTHHKNFIDLTADISTDSNKHTSILLDYGTDGLHPGPLQHQHYADKLFNFIKEN
jgi:hypothetical protein